MHSIADEIIKPGPSLSSAERLELYHRQYWFRAVLGHDRKNLAVNRFGITQPTRLVVLECQFEGLWDCHGELILLPACQHRISQQARS